MSAQLTQRDSLDAEPELAPQEPPPWVIRSTAWLLIAAFLCALLIAIVMRLPETVDCRFVLIPATGADPISARKIGSATVAGIRSAAIHRFRQRITKPSASHNRNAAINSQAVERMSREAAPVVLARVRRPVSHVESIARSSKPRLNSELLARKIVIQATLRH